MTNSSSTSNNPNGGTTNNNSSSHLGSSTYQSPIYSKKQKQKIVSIRTRNRRKIPFTDLIIFHIFSFLHGIDIENCCKASHIFQSVGFDESKFLEYFIIKYHPYTTFYHDYNRTATTLNPPNSSVINTNNTSTTGTPSSNNNTPMIGSGGKYHPKVMPQTTSSSNLNVFMNNGNNITGTSPTGSSNSNNNGMMMSGTPSPTTISNNNGGSTFSLSALANSQINFGSSPLGTSSILAASIYTPRDVYEKQQQPNIQQQQLSEQQVLDPTQLIAKEEKEYYKRPKCNWRNAVKYREQMQTYYRFSKVQLVKVYTQPDLKILTLSSSSLKEAIKGKGWVDVESPTANTKDNKEIQTNVNLTTVKPVVNINNGDNTYEEEFKKEKEKLEKERELLVEEFSGIMNYTNTNTEDWKNNGFHLTNVRLLDGRVILNTRKNFRHTTKPFKHHYSYDLLTYSLYSAKDSHLANRLDEDRKKLLLSLFDNHEDEKTEISIREEFMMKTNNFNVEQWASKIINYSSEYISRSRSEGSAAPTTADEDLSTAHSRADYPPFSVLNLLGVINTYPKYGSFGTAWSPANRTSGYGSLEFIELEIDEEIYITEVRIFETFCPGGVFKIATFNKESNSYDTVWLGKPYDTNCRVMDRSRVFSPKLLKKNYRTKRIRIDFDLRKSPSGWTEIDGILVRGTLTPNDTLRVLAQQHFQKKRDTIKLNKEVLHFPYSFLSHSPFDYQFGVLCFVYTESSYYHINSTLVVIGGTELLKDEVFLEVTYSRDYISAVKLLSNKTCMAIVKLARVPVQYCVHIYDITSKRLSKTFELKDLPSETEVKVWELTQQIIACSADNRIYIYDISHSSNVQNWKLLHVLQGHYTTVTSLSLNTELIDVCNVLVSGSADGTAKIWSLHTGNCLLTLVHPSPVTTVKLIAGGSMVATVCVNESKIRIWSICGQDAGQLVRVINLPSLSTGGNGYCQKEIYFDDSYFTYFEKGTNEYVLGRFYSSDKVGERTQIVDEGSSLNKYNIVNKYQTNPEACTIL
ncbi:hypothetical protein ABK040_015100 [Willaertia magna]